MNAVAYFQSLGISPKAILTDNGSLPFCRQDLSE